MRRSTPAGLGDASRETLNRGLPREGSSPRWVARGAGRIVVILPPDQVDEDRRHGIGDLADPYAVEREVRDRAGRREVQADASGH
jgi:hypothetical protein